MVRGPQEPSDSIATGTKQTLGGRDEYLAIFFDSASAPTALEPDVTILLYDGAKESGIVASQTKGLPRDQGIKVTPSGLLPSDLDKPEGSRLDGTPAAEKAL